MAEPRIRTNIEIELDLWKALEPLRQERRQNQFINDAIRKSLEELTKNPGQ